METEMMPKKDYVTPEINEVELLCKGCLLECVSGSDAPGCPVEFQ